jgi:protein O-mannosyl-transferase
MRQNKPLNNNKKEDAFKAKALPIIIALIIIPVVYLMIRNYTVPNKGPKVELIAGVDTVTTSIANQATELQAAIDLAASQPNENNYINLGLMYYNRVDYNKCIEVTKKALEYNPKSSLAYNNLCSAYNQLRMWDEAIAAGKKALEIKPDDQLAANNLKVAEDGKSKQGN